MVCDSLASFLYYIKRISIFFPTEISMTIDIFVLTYFLWYYIYMFWNIIKFACVVTNAYIINESKVVMKIKI